MRRTGSTGSVWRGSAARSSATPAARQIEAIAQALVAHGRAAGGSRGARLRRHDRRAADRRRNPWRRSLERAVAGTPALLVVGAVADFASTCAGSTTRPLFGRRIVVTRSREQAGELIDMLEERGAEAIAAPTIRIAPPEDIGRARRGVRRGGAPSTGSSSPAPTPSNASCSRSCATGRPRSQGHPPLRGRPVDRGGG